MIKAKKIYLASALALSLVLPACSGDNTEKAETAPTQTTDAQHTMQAGTPVSDDALSGTVVETFNSGGYTYIQLDNGQEKIWVAIGQADIKEGQEISLTNGPMMREFHSPSLNRTFPEIIFSAGIKGSGAASPHGSSSDAQAGKKEGTADSSFIDALKSAAPAQETMDSSAPSGGSGKAIVSAQKIEVAKAEGDNGHTVAEVFASADKLNGKTIKVRGKVVKVSPGIMGVNWLHLQDGSGTPWIIPMIWLSPPTPKSL